MRFLRHRTSPRCSVHIPSAAGHSRDPEIASARPSVGETSRSTAPWQPIARSGILRKAPQGALRGRSSRERALPANCRGRQAPLAPAETRPTLPAVDFGASVMYASSVVSPVHRCAPGAFDVVPDDMKPLATPGGFACCSAVIRQGCMIPGHSSGHLLGQRPIPISPPGHRSPEVLWSPRPPTTVGAIQTNPRPTTWGSRFQPPPPAYANPVVGGAG